MEKEYLYHYTSVVNLKGILEDGLLKAKGTFKTNNELMLWFSKNFKWEPTATKMLVTDKGRWIQLSKEQQDELMGLARVSILRTSDVMNWNEYKKISKKTKAELDKMEEHGIKLGASCSDWFCLKYCVPIDSWKKIEIWNGKDWIDYDKRKLKALITDPKKKEIDFEDYFMHE
jgi:hypothetical protein